MKSERRHELATNELADWVMHFPEFVRKNRNVIIIVAIFVVAIGIYSYFYYTSGTETGKSQEKLTSYLERVNRSKEETVQGRIQGLAISDDFFITAKQLEALAVEAELVSPASSAIALVKQAEIIRAELHYRAEEATTEVFQYQINQAKTIYQKALDKAPDNAAVAGMAKFGLGLCAEELGDFEGAMKIYQEISTDPRYETSLCAARAQLRAKTIGDYKGKVFFTKAAPEPETAEPTSVFSDIQVPAAETNSTGE